MTKQAPIVLEVVPNESSMIMISDGAARYVEIDANGHRTVWLGTDEARTLLNSGLPSCVLWREANMALTERLGQISKPEPTTICPRASTGREARER
jgi:hypothetical protein